MAWLSLVIVTLIFFSPMIGLGTSLAAQDVALRVSLPFITLSFSIPFTGPLRLFFYSVVLWLVIWLAPLLLERLLNIDFISKISLKNDLIYASRPYISNRIAVFLAKTFLWFFIIKSLLIIGLQTAIEYLVPIIASRLISNLSEWATGLFSQGVQSLIGIRSSLSVTLFVFCILVLIASKAFEWEKKYRCKTLILNNQFKRRQNQKDIEFPLYQD
jgi:hypothetical protein